MLSFLRTLTRPQIPSLNTIQISRDALLSNLSYLQSLKPWHEIFPVLKSNAYGHGLKQVSSILKNTNLSYICVDSFPEYQIVKDYARKKSLIIGETLPTNYKWYNHRRATPCVYNIPTLKALIASWYPRKIHLFLNTGMNREGIQDRELPVFLDLLQWSRIELEGVMSHLANADETDATFNSIQEATFSRMLDVIRKQVWSIRYIHLWNSAGISKLKRSEYSAWRSWLSFFWYEPVESDDPYVHIYKWLTPALSILSTVTALQQILPGDLVSYTWSYVADQNTTVATIPFWYTEWLSRRLSNNRTVRHIKTDTLLPLIGNICMNLSCLEVWETDVQLGDQIELIAPDWVNTIEEYAKRCWTIQYEVLVGLGDKVRREII